MSDDFDVPDFKDLPAVEGMPQGCAWGIFDKPDKKDTFGCLNHLTPSRVAAAATEVQHGISVSLNAPLDGLRLGFRRDLEHKAIHWQRDIGANINSWDDEVTFNTQSSSQWDSLLHFAHQPTGKFYNGHDPSKELLMQSSGEYDAKKEVPSLDHWHDRGGLVARGVLLDYVAYAKAKGMVEYSPFKRCVITAQDLEEVARHQGTELRKGDVLIIRTGFMEDMMALGSPDEQKAMLASGGMAGIQGTQETAAWFWNGRFAAVAADNIAFEVMPPEKEDGSIATHDDLVLHPYFLSLFGLHIGELWYLNSLADQCAKLNRYSFLLTSVPLNVPGLVGSPPNALALF